jgi:hypothetical protein
MYLKPTLESRLNVLFSPQNDINYLQTLFLLFSVFLGTFLMTFSSISRSVISPNRFMTSKKLGFS